ncbi:hypothetical protein HYALB_00003872 [Hymenoscyphus albidus]|uniref:Potassium transport protein n=1 Tax=Hymenoscyphus albidus TaxID=595503 RepID=A0A9N9LU59_9HELO|nr:hypothetical protein HYALB_00003872 [Hymenoscyphus albidus]
MSRNQGLAAMRKGDRFKAIRGYLPPLNFITIHYFYFIFTCLLFSVIFWGSSNPSRSITFIDSLFCVVSAMTETGLNTVNLSEMNTFQQFILWFLIVIGSTIFVSISTVLTRKRVFERRLHHVVKAQREARRDRRRSMGSSAAEIPAIKRLQQARATEEPVDKSEFESRHSGPRDPTSQPSQSGSVAHQLPGHGKDGTDDSDYDTAKPVVMGGALLGEGNEDIAPIQRDHVMHYAPAPPSSASNRVLSFAGVGANPNSSSYNRSRNGSKQRNKNVTSISESQTSGHENISQLHYPSYLGKDTEGRNAQFHDLTKEEREHLGGVEYRAITLLAYVIPMYWALWQALGCVGLGAYMAHNKADVIGINGVNPWWLGIFNGASAFNNSGMSLLDANMIPFQTSVYALMTMGIMILAGNTAYPLFLRLILYLMLKLLCLICPSPDQHPEHKATLRFVLKYPRRVYTNLFPSAQTWWLCFMVVCLNGIDWVAFEVLNIGNEKVEVIPKEFRILGGLFQAIAVRSGGFYIISMTSLRIGLQVLYVIMMYVSVYPVVITMRHSNVYEERSLGIYAEDKPYRDAEDPKLNAVGKIKRSISEATNKDVGFSTLRGVGVGTQQFVHQQIRAQLSHDLWLLVIAILFITIIETSNFERDPQVYSGFNVVFEVVSGYGCVGISTGLPDQAYSFAGGWKTGSKLILCLVMLRGRHRGLPVALDRAVQLPGELGEGEEVDEALRRSLSVRCPSVHDA